MKCKRSSKRTTYGRGSWHSGFSNWTFLCWNLLVLFFALCAEAFLCWNLPVLFFALSSGFSNWTSLCWNLPVLFFALCADDLRKKILGSGGRRWWGCTATQQIAGKDSSLHFIIIEYNSQSRAGTKPPLQVKCLRRFTIWRGCFYRRAPQVKIFLRASRASRALQFYIVSFSFSSTLYLRHCPLGSTLPPYFFLL